MSESILLPAGKEFTSAALAPPICITDWRNPAGAGFDRTRRADLWSLYWTATETSTKGINGRILVAFQPGLPWSAPERMTDHPYAVELRQLAERFGARTDLKLFEGPDGGYLELIDITKRGFVPTLAGMWLRRFGWAAGMHSDYWINPASFFPPGTFTEDYLAKWDRSLNSFASILRADDPHRILIGQNDRMTGDTWGAMSGCYIEQSPYFNGRSLDQHEGDLDTLATLMKMAEPGRELVSVCEVRKPWVFDPEQKLAIENWCARLGLYMSVGRDSTAFGARLV